MVTSFCFGEHRGGLLRASAAECLSQKATARSGKEGAGCIWLCWWVQVRRDGGPGYPRSTGRRSGNPRVWPHSHPSWGQDGTGASVAPLRERTPDAKRAGGHLALPTLSFHGDFSLPVSFALFLPDPPLPQKAGSFLPSGGVSGRAARDFMRALLALGLKWAISGFLDPTVIADSMFMFP